MIGNDIVDLRLAESNSRASETRFWEKVLHPLEWEQFQSIKGQMVNKWVLWAAKESAYKLERRAGCQRLHRPKAYQVYMDSMYVIGTRGTYAFRMLQTPEFIHVYCCEKGVQDTVSLIDFWDAKVVISSGEYILEKLQSGALSARFRNTHRTLPVSKSHHGRFQAFVWPAVDQYDGSI